jgi:hypothetical protein
MARPLIDITGMVFGRLTAIKLVRTVPVKRGCYLHYWLCQCSCGNTKEILRCNLRTKSHTRSCGCLSDERRRTQKNYKEGSAFRAVLSGYKTDAKRRGYTWELTDEQFRTITQSNCHYTGRSPRTVHTTKCGAEQYVYNGIDRKDSTKGYSLENCVPCCKQANLMKRDVDYEEFITLCKEIARNITP